MADDPALTPMGLLARESILAADPDVRVVEKTSMDVGSSVKGRYGRRPIQARMPGDPRALPMSIGKSVLSPQESLS